MATQTKSYKTEATAKAAMKKQGLSESEYRPVLVETMEQADDHGYDADTVGRYVIESVEAQGDTAGEPDLIEDDWTAKEGELLREVEEQLGVWESDFASAGHAHKAAAEAGLTRSDYTLERDDSSQRFHLVPVSEEEEEAELTVSPPWEDMPTEDDDEEDETPLPSIEELKKKAAPKEVPANTLKANRSESTVEKPVAVVHRICAEMYEAAAKEGTPQPRRKDLVAAAEAAGVAYWTARTQVQVWLKNRNQQVQVAMQRESAAANADA